MKRRWKDKERLKKSAEEVEEKAQETMNTASTETAAKKLKKASNDESEEQSAAKGPDPPEYDHHKKDKDPVGIDIPTGRVRYNPEGPSRQVGFDITPKQPDMGGRTHTGDRAGFTPNFSRNPKRERGGFSEKANVMGTTATTATATETSGSNATAATATKSEKEGNLGMATAEATAMATANVTEMLQATATTTAATATTANLLSPGGGTMPQTIIAQGLGGCPENVEGRPRPEGHQKSPALMGRAEGNHGPWKTIRWVEPPRSQAPLGGGMLFLSEAAR